MESDPKAVPQDPASQAIPEAQITDPGSIATTKQGVNDSSLTPELESLSSGSEPEDQFYEASEEPSVEQQLSPEAVGTDQDEKTKSTAEDTEQKGNEGLASVEEHDGGGMSKGGDSSCEQQRSVDSVDKEFVMVNYPMCSSDHSDTQQQPHSQQAIAPNAQDNLQQATDTSPQDNISPDVGSSDTRPKCTQTNQSEDVNQSSSSPTIINVVAEPESAESAKRLIAGDQEVTGNVVGENEGGQQEIEGEVRGGSEVAMERESSDAEGEKGAVSAPAFESLGLLYASSPNIKHNRYSQKLFMCEVCASS